MCGSVCSRVTGVLWDLTCGLSWDQDGVSQLFGFLLLPQEAHVQTQEGVTDAHGAVHRGQQQGEEGQLLLPRRQREDDLTGDRHDNQSQQVDRLQRMKQSTLAAERRK